MGFESLTATCASVQSPAHKKVFLMFKWNFLYFSLYPLPLALSSGTTGKSLAPSSLLLPQGICTHW